MNQSYLRQNNTENGKSIEVIQLNREKDADFKITNPCKKISIFSIIILLMTFMSDLQLNAQRIGDLDGINYQAVAIDEDGKEIVGKDIEGKPLYEKEIGVRFTISKGKEGTIQYQETHSTLTNEYGLFSVIIGHGEKTGKGQYSELLNLPWIDAEQWLKVEISIENDGNYRLVSLQRFMTVPYAFYADDLADDAVTTEKILNEEILAEDINTGAVETSEILDETILAEDIGTGSVETSEILDETILAEDIGTGSIETSEILDSTLLNEDIKTSAVDSRAILNETILAEDIGTGSVETSEILDETIQAEDIDTGSVATSELLDEGIQAVDIDTGAVTSSEIANETIQNEDIKDSTINLSTKVTDTLGVQQGGTGLGTVEEGDILVGGESNRLDTLSVIDSVMVFSNKTGKTELYKLRAGLRASIEIDEANKTIYIHAIEQDSSPDKGGNTVATGNIPAGNQVIRNFPVDNVNLGDIILVTANKDLQGITMTAYVKQQDKVHVVLYNGTGSAINLGEVEFKIANFGQ